MEQKLNGKVGETPYQSFKEAGTLTDLCYREGEPEVHLISLLEERIPRYTLRADTLTNFAGYENEDWAITTPCLLSDFDPDLSIDLMEDTLKYFILGGARLSQVTKTYNDSRALTLLLEEKERDLEIASEIGRILVKKVRLLDKTVERLTKETEKTKTQVLALQKELTTRDLLLRVYVEDFESDSEPEEDGQKVVSDYTSFKLSTVDIEAIRRRVRGLQLENDKMGSAVVKMKSEAQEVAEREDQLVADCVEHLLQTTCSLELLREELDSKTEIIAKQQDEINAHVEQILTLEGKSRELSEDLKRASKRVSEAEDQKQTAISETEVWRRRNSECLSLLGAAQDEIKILRKAQRPASVIHRNYSSNSIVFSPFLPSGSLASELHDSQKKNLFYHLGYSPSSTNAHSRKVMDVAKAVSRASSQRCLVASESQIFTGADDESSSSVDLMNDGDSLESQCGSSGHISFDLSETELIEDTLSGTSQNQRQAMVDVGNSSLGQPGLPGSNDLEVALMRLSSPAGLQQPSSSQNVAGRNCSSPQHNTESRRVSPMIFAEVPLSIMDSFRSRSSSVSNASEQISFAKPTIPEKLQIIKPLEGSTTLNQWKALAVPNLDGFLEFRPGVQTRGQPVEQLFEDEVFSLSDYEEDCIPGVTQVPFSSPCSPSPTSSKTSGCNSENSRFDPVSAYANESRRHSCIPNITNVNSHPFYDFGPRTLPDIVTCEKTPTSLTQMPKSMPSCSIM